MTTTSRHSLPSFTWPLLAGVVLLYAWYVLAVQNADLLWQVQNFTSLLPDSPHTYAGHPGAWREWAGDWLTQCCYYPWLGAALLVMLWAVGALALVRACRLQQGWQLAALVPVAALLASITQLGYWLFCLKAPSYWFGPSIGFACVALWMWLLSRLSSWAVPMALWVWLKVGFPLLGWYATLGLATAIIMLLTICRPPRDGRRRCTWLSLVAIALSATTLCLYYHHAPSVHWREPLPLYGLHHLANPECQSTLLEVAFWVMAASVLLMPLVGWLQTWRHGARLHWLGLPLLITALCLANMMHYRNANFHAELRMLRQLEEGRWDDLLLEMKQLQQRPTREMVLMKDVALAQQGQLGQRAFCYDYRGVRPQMNVALPIHINHSAGPLIYYWLGLPNYAFMWCMEDNIEYGLSPYFLKLMYRASMAAGQTATARKYYLLLTRHHLFYRHYAEVSPSELQQVRRFMTGHDALTNDRGYCEIYLMQRLPHERYADAACQQLAVHEAMLMRDREAFASALSHYAALTPGQPLPRHFVEAQMYFGMAEPDAALSQYRARLQQLQEAGVARLDIGRQLYPAFGQTYWWYYDFCLDHKSY